MNATRPLAVQLADANSLFPRILAAEWRKRGYEVAVATAYNVGYSSLPDGSPVLKAQDHETRLFRIFKHRVLLPILRRLENRAPRYRDKFDRITGIEASEWQPWFATFAGNLGQSVGVKRAAMSLNPRFVFGHEVTAYGVSTALCRGVPRILFPWGGDVFIYAETSPYMDWIARFALNNTDLIVPSSTSGAQHIIKRFGVPSERVVPVSWGVKRNSFYQADPAKRRQLCAKWKITPDSTIILNSRRFLPPWGCNQVLEAFISFAHVHPTTHFILFGGADTKEYTDLAKARANAAGVASRFTVLEGNAPLEVCSELMGIADIFTSLSGRGDMRSSSVLQAACAGGIPVLSPLDEWREIEKRGFRAFYTESRTADSISKALHEAIANRALWQEIRGANEEYLKRHEDWDTQMDRLLELIEQKCSSYSAGGKHKMK